MEKTIWTAILGIVLLLAIVSGIWYSYSDDSTVSYSDQDDALCQDSDRGKEIRTKGMAMTKDEKGTTLHITGDSCATMTESGEPGEAKFIEGLPSCSGETCYVLEGFCKPEGNMVIDSKEFIPCPDGCDDGACSS